MGIAGERAAEAKERAQAENEELDLTPREKEQRTRRAMRGAEREEVLLCLEELEAWYRDLVVVAAGAESAAAHVDRLDAAAGGRNGRQLPGAEARRKRCARRGVSSRSSSSRPASRSRRSSSSSAASSPGTPRTCLVQTFPESHNTAGLLLVVTVIASPLLEGLVTAVERAGSAPRAGRARAIGGALVETTIISTGKARESDRGTKWILVARVLAAIFLGWRAAGVPRGGHAGEWMGDLRGGARPHLVRGRASRVVDRHARPLLSPHRRRTGGHRVVNGGPYRAVRHPAYLGNLLATAGLGLALGNWVSLAILVVVPALGHLPRILVEERELERGLGEQQYTGLNAGRKRLVPGVW